MLNVKYALTHATRPAPPGYNLLTTAEGLSLYENPNALPRSFFVERVIQVQTPEESMKALRLPEFDPRTTAIIEGGSKLDMVESGNGAAEIIEEKRNRLRIATENEKDGILILSDNFYPGWRALVDGAPVEIFLANYTMRAVKVPAGRHIVSFEFEPETLRKSTQASLASAAVVGLSLVVLFIGGARRKRRAGE